jgi:hypothetical protein
MVPPTLTDHGIPAIVAQGFAVLNPILATLIRQAVADVAGANLSRHLQGAVTPG